MSTAINHIDLRSTVNNLLIVIQCSVELYNIPSLLMLMLL